MSQKTILYFPTIDYFFLRQRPQNLLSQFARNGYKVIYCNLTQLNIPPEEVEPNLFIHHDFNKLISDIKVKRIKIDIKYATWAKSVEYFDLVPSKLTIYDSVDSFDQWKSFENEAMKKSDIILTTSQFLYDLRSQHHNNVHLVRNACDSSFINTSHIVPKEMDTTEPKILFCGAIGEWVKTSLIKSVAEKYPNTYFVGREFPKQCPSNVINLGLKNHSELINYYYSADVCLLPFNAKLEVVKAANPVKQYEHMACGKPTVATSWHETDVYSDVILTSKTDEEFLFNVDKAIELSKRESFKQKCFDIARENTWEIRFKQIDNAIQQFYSTSRQMVSSYE